MITKEKHPMRVLFFRDHEIGGEVGRCVRGITNSFAPQSRSADDRHR
jgi:hypothetical protein